jgi:hypothetical protein
MQNLKIKKCKKNVFVQNARKFENKEGFFAHKFMSQNPKEFNPLSQITECRSMLHG